MDSMGEGVSNSTPSFCRMVTVFLTLAVVLEGSSFSRVEFIPRFLGDATLDTFSIQRFACQKVRIHESESVRGVTKPVPRLPKGSL